MKRITMNMNYFAGITLEALLQYIDGNANDEVKHTVDNWLQEDSTHPVFFSKIKHAWLDLDDVKDLNEATLDQDWKNILGRLSDAKKNKDEGDEPSRQLWYHKPWLYAAATIALVFSVAGGYFLGSSGNDTGISDPLVYNKIVVPMGEKSQLVLSDGTKIWVNAGSTIRFPNRFGSKIREIWLDGEAYFEVAKDKSKPFYVRTSELNIKVLGTTFNVKAYSDENIIETTLLEGSVSLERKQKNGNEKTNPEVFLKPNHKAIYLKDGTSLVTEEIKREVSEPLQARKIIISKPVQPEITTSWREGKIVIEDEALGNVIKELERRYDVIIHVNNEAINEIRYTGVLKNVSVEQAMKAIQITIGFKYAMEGNHIYIY